LSLLRDELDEVDASGGNGRSNAERMIANLVKMAVGGDLKAVQIVLDRICGPVSLTPAADAITLESITMEMNRRYREVLVSREERSSVQPEPPAEPPPPPPPEPQHEPQHEPRPEPDRRPSVDFGGINFYPQE